MRNPGFLSITGTGFLILFASLAGPNSPARAEPSPATPSTAAQSPATQLAQTVVESLGSVAIGVAWQVTEFDITPDSGCCTTSMTNGFEPTPMLYVQIPVRMLVGDGQNGIGYTLRAGYRRFELKQQDLGGTGDEMKDYGTRVSGRAFHLTPILVARMTTGQQELSAGLGLGIGHFTADGNILVRRSVSGPPFSVIETEPVHVSTFATSLGAFTEYRLGPIVAAMETAIMQGSSGGKTYDLGISSFSLAWRIDF